MTRGGGGGGGGGVARSLRGRRDGSWRQRNAGRLVCIVFASRSVRWMMGELHHGPSPMQLICADGSHVSLGSVQ